MTPRERVRVLREAEKFDAEGWSEFDFVVAVRRALSALEVVEKERDTLREALLGVSKFSRSHYQGCPSFVGRNCVCPYGIARDVLGVED